MTRTPPSGAPRAFGFTPAGRLVEPRIRKAAEARGFAVARLLTHWDEIVGPAIAGAARPVDIRYGREGLGATLTLLTTGAQAPILEMQKEEIRDRVNGCYGYRAVSRIRLTQTAAQGFAEAQAAFGAAPKAAAQAPPDPAVAARAAAAAEGIRDTELRLALAALAAHVLARAKP